MREPEPMRLVVVKPQRERRNSVAKGDRLPRHRTQDRAELESRAGASPTAWLIDMRTRRKVVSVSTIALIKGCCRRDLDTAAWREPELPQSSGCMSAGSPRSRPLVTSRVPEELNT